MSIKIMSQVWELKIPDATAKLTLMAMADFSDDDGYCFPSYQKLANKISKSRVTAIRNVNKLIEMGYLEKDTRERKDKSNSSNLFKINTSLRESANDTGITDDTSIVDDTRGVSHMILGGITDDTSPGITGDTPINITINKEPSTNHQTNHHFLSRDREKKQSEAKPQKNQSEKKQTDRLAKASIDELNADSFALKNQTSFENTSKEYKTKLKAYIDKLRLNNQHYQSYDEFENALLSKGYKYKNFARAYIQWQKNIKVTNSASKGLVTTNEKGEAVGAMGYPLSFMSAFRQEQLKKIDNF